MAEKTPVQNAVDYVKSCIRFWVTSEFFAIGLSSFLGVGIRVALKNHFDTHHGVTNATVAYGPFMQMFFAQDYLLSNIFGCFLMAVFITNMTPISKFSLPFYKSLTTGLCGSITTYSSWINGAVDDEFGKSWYEILLMMVFEFWLTWGAFTMGYAAAKMTFQLKNMPLLRRAGEILSGGNSADAAGGKDASPTEPAKVKEAETKNALHASNSPPAASSGPAASSASAMPTVTEERDSQMSLDSVDLETGTSSSSSGPPATSTVPFSGRKSISFSNSIQRTSGAARDSGVSDGRASKARNTMTSRQSTTNRTSVYDLSPDDKEANNEQTSLLMAPKNDINFNKYSARISVWREDGLEEEDEKTIQNMTISEGRRQRLLARLQAIRENLRGMGRTASTADPTLEKPSLDEGKQRTNFELFTLWFQRYEFYIWSTLFTLTAGLVWTLLILSPFLPFYQNNTLYKNTLQAVSLAPFGAWFRWSLTRFPRLKATWPEMNPQTMIANLSAVTIFCCLVRIDPNYSWNYGIDQGFNGACSTVSTFFAEIHSLYFEKGPMVALRYCLATFLLSIAIVQIIRAP